MAMTSPTQLTPQGPYAQAALQYWAAGWRGILPLPANRKSPVPDGYTGGAGVDPSYPDVYAWTEDRPAANIGLRLPPHVLGIDIDAYGDKEGRATIEAAVGRNGELPKTWRSSSRDDGLSGIYLFRVPEGLAWPGELGSGIELIQHRYRYTVVWPSVHPELGTRYRWFTPEGVVSTSLPTPDDLPMLPEAWVADISGGELYVATARNAMAYETAARWIVAAPAATQPPCLRMAAAIDQAIADLDASAHNGARDGTLRIVRLGSEGHGGAIAGLTELRAAFLANATSGKRKSSGMIHRTQRQAEKEWTDLVTSAVNVVSADDPVAPSCDCYGQITQAIAGAEIPLQRESADEDTPPSGSTELPGKKQGSSSDFIDGASFILDAPETVPALWGDSDEVLWAKGEALMLVGPPGVGKTTLGGQVLRGRLGLTPEVLGTSIEPTASKVLYLAMDRPQQIARSLRRTFRPEDRQVLEDKLVVWVGPPAADIAKRPATLAAMAQLAGADTIFLDSLKDAAVGLTEDEVGAGYNRARQVAIAAGIEIVEYHHLVKRGPNGSKPTQLADVYGSMHLTSGAGSVVLLWGQAGDLLVELNHLKSPAAAVGPWMVQHDHDAGQSSLVDQVDLVLLVRDAGGEGMTAKAAATVIFPGETSRSKELRAARKLDRLVKDGVLTKRAAAHGGASDGRKGSAPARWFISYVPVDNSENINDVFNDTEDLATSSFSQRRVNDVNEHDDVSAGQINDVFNDVNDASSAATSTTFPSTPVGVLGTEWSAESAVCSKCGKPIDEREIAMHGEAVCGFCRYGGDR